MSYLFLEVKIAPKIKIDSTPKEYKVKKGEDVNIEVKFTASPTPTDEWTVNGTVIKKNKRVSFFINNVEHLELIIIIHIFLSSVTFIKIKCPYKKV